MKFKVLRGRHAAGGGKDESGKEKPVIIYNAGDIVETDVDLERMFNVGEFRKFERVPDDAVATPAQPQAAGNDTFESMTVEELRQFAASEEIDLGRARSKAEIINVIRMNA